MTPRKNPILCVLLSLAVWVVGCNPTKVENDRLTFSLTGLDGDRVSDSDSRFEGKVVLIDIWGTWCPPCIDEIPYLIALHNKYREQGLEILSVEFDMRLLGSEDERRSAMKEFIQRAGINYPVFLGGEMADVQEVFPALRNFKGFPTTVYIGRDGLVRRVEMGFMEANAPAREELIAALLKEEV